jgi:hypothetical protein
MRHITAKPAAPITCNDLAHSLKACYRVEDAIWRQLQTRHCDERSRAADIWSELILVREHCPGWCDIEAWGRMIGVFGTWAGTCGDLQLFWRLRRKRSEPNTATDREETNGR